MPLFLVWTTENMPAIFLLVLEIYDVKYGKKRVCSEIILSKIKGTTLIHSENIKLQKKVWYF